MTFAELLTVAKKVNNYIIDATDTGTGNDKWESSTLQEWTVPADKRWILLYGVLSRENSSTSTCLILDSSGGVIGKIHDMSAGTGVTPLIPVGFATREHLQQGQMGQLILDAGEQVQLTLGTAQGSAAYASLVVLEIDV